MLNALQKQILDATFDYIFSTLSEDVSPDVGMKALGAIKQPTLYQAHKELLKSQNLLQVVDQVKAIYAHEYPQNRSMGSPYVGQTAGWVAWEPNGHNRGIARERQGLLGLTARNNNATPHVTKEDVVQYLDNLIDSCRKKLQARLEQEQTEATQASPITIDIETLFAFIQAVVGFHDVFKHEIANYRGLAPSAAASYMTSLLNAIRKDAWEAFMQNPENFAIPKELQKFIIDYLTEHPILLEAKTYEKYTKELEKQYLLQGNVDIANLVPNTPIPQAVTPFWTEPSTPPSAIDIKTFTQAACDLVDNLSQKLKQFSALSSNAANTYVSNLLTAIRKNQVKEFFEKPETYGVPAELKDLLGKEFQRYPVLLQGQSLGASSIKTIEVALVSKSIQEIRQSLETVSNSSVSSSVNDNNANVQASTRSSMTP